MPKRTRDYEESLLEDLREPEAAAAYLNAALEDLDEPDGTELFLMALRNIMRAQGVSSVARDAGLGRESLYKSLSAAGNPKLKGLLSILRVMGLRLAVQAASQPAPQPSPTKRPRRKPALAKAS